MDDFEENLELQVKAEAAHYPYLWPGRSSVIPPIANNPRYLATYKQFRLPIALLALDHKLSA